MFASQFLFAPGVLAIAIACVAYRCRICRIARRRADSRVVKVWLTLDCRDKNIVDAALILSRQLSQLLLAVTMLAMALTLLTPRSAASSLVGLSSSLMRLTCNVGCVSGASSPPLC